MRINRQVLKIKNQATRIILPLEWRRLYRLAQDDRDVSIVLYNVRRPKDTCIHLDAVEEHGTNVTSLPASYRMMSG